jgi:predicted dehydrogenase
MGVALLTTRPTVAILGLGSIGQRHARNFLSLGCRTLGFDPEPQGMALLAAIGGEPAPSPVAAAAAASLVVVATPTQRHVDDLQVALNAGRPALVEKPIAHSVSAATETVRRFKASGLDIYPAMNLRFLPAVQKVKQRIAEGALGNLLWARLICSSWLPDWRPGADYRRGYAADIFSGGVLFDLVHEVDLANYLIGPAVTVGAAARRTGQLDMATEDCAALILRHTSGVISSLHLDFATRVRQRVTEIAGSDGLVRLHLREQRVEEFAPDGTVRQAWTWDSPADQCYVAEADAALKACMGHARFPIAVDEALGVLDQITTARRLCGLAVEA